MTVLLKEIWKYRKVNCCIVDVNFTWMTTTSWTDSCYRTCPWKRMSPDLDYSLRSLPRFLHPHSFPPGYQKTVLQMTESIAVAGSTIVDHASILVAASTRAWTAQIRPYDPPYDTPSSLEWNSKKVRRLDLFKHTARNFVFTWNFTLASFETVGLLGNCTSVALRIVFSSRIVACDWLCPKGFLPYKHW